MSAREREYPRKKYYRGVRKRTQLKNTNSKQKKKTLDRFKQNTSCMLLYVKCCLPTEDSTWQGRNGESQDETTVSIPVVSVFRRAGFVFAQFLLGSRIPRCGVRWTGGFDREPPGASVPRLFCFSGRKYPVVYTSSPSAPIASRTHSSLSLSRRYFWFSFRINIRIPRILASFGFENTQVQSLSLSRAHSFN